MGQIGAGEGNRTLVFSLEGCCSTIELHPLLNIWSPHSENSFCLRITNNQSVGDHISGGKGRIRTFVDKSRQIYSLLPLTTRPPFQRFLPPPCRFDKIVDTVCQFFCRLSSTFFILCVKCCVFVLIHSVVTIFFL